ncbi:asialoglycoprotein receptor 2-like [Pristis pectinata]|uniref:asialoglycoprotein receptor 2-like n=1 Tax=Pristis pectinata TaxID=685728 RepID=UPI00223CFD16|nr:asialoglycoprotein receptor 2-like [Pristis pectinata]
MAREPAYNDYENFNVDGQQKAKWNTGNQFKSLFCGKGLVFLILILVSVFLILLISGVIKCTETNETVDEFQKQVQMEISEVMSNVSHRTEMRELEQSIRNEVTRMSARVLEEMSRKINDILVKISVKMETLSESSCQNRQCPHSWVYYNGSCYYFSTKKATWSASQQYCSIYGANLLVTEREDEQYFVVLHSQHIHFWIGLNDHGNEGQWEWVDGTAYNSTPTFWNDGEPNNAGHGEDCVHIESHGKWNDNECSSEFHWICELKRDSA